MARFQKKTNKKPTGKKVSHQTCRSDAPSLAPPAPTLPFSTPPPQQQPSSFNMGYFPECPMEVIRKELNLIDSIWRSRECTGVVMCLPTTNTVRCAKCAAYVKNHKRKVSEWQQIVVGPSRSTSPAEPTLLTPRAKAQRMSLWREPEEVERDVQYAVRVLEGNEQQEALLRIARHLAVEPQLQETAQMVIVSDTQTICFCPNFGKHLSGKCRGYEWKHRKNMKSTLCSLCLARARYHDQKTNEAIVTDADTTTNTNTNTDTNTDTNSVTNYTMQATDTNSRANINNLPRVDLETRYRNKALQVKQLHRAIVRLHARAQLQAVTNAVKNTHGMECVDGNVQTTTLQVVDALSTAKGEEQMRLLLQQVFSDAGLIPEHLPAGYTVTSVKDALMRKVYHARCGAIFAQLSSALRTNSSVSLRSGLKALSALKKSVAESKAKAKNKSVHPVTQLENEAGEESNRVASNVHEDNKENVP